MLPELGNNALQTMQGFGMSETSQPLHVKKKNTMDIGTAKEGGLGWASPSPILPSFGLQRIITLCPRHVEVVLRTTSGYPPGRRVANGL